MPQSYKERIENICTRQLDKVQKMIDFDKELLNRAKKENNYRMIRWYKGCIEWDLMEQERIFRQFDKAMAE